MVTKAETSGLALNTENYQKRFGSSRYSNFKLNRKRTKATLVVPAVFSKCLIAPPGKQRLRDFIIRQATKRFG